jgi:hypothetical protein
MSQIEAELSKCTIAKVNYDILVICHDDSDFISLLKSEKIFIKQITKNYQIDWEKIILQSKQGPKQTTFYPS